MALSCSQKTISIIKGNIDSQNIDNRYIGI